MRRFLIAALAATSLSGCAIESVYSPNEVVAKSIYRHAGPTSITLFTMIDNATGAGGHSSLMINGSQRVIFDPAGTFQHESVAEQNDLVYGITPKVADVYIRYHARETYHVLIQTVPVSRQVADQAISVAKGYGAVLGGQCAQSASSVLTRVPGFTNIKKTWFPNKLSAQFAKIPGVTSRKLHEYDSDDNSKVLKAWDPNA